MRLWTLHPKHLDAAGLVAAWREALLAQAVLRGKTRGYKKHPQLIRFQSQTNPVAAIASYLVGLHCEAEARGYSFDASKISRLRCEGKIPETRGQVQYEWEHLGTKLRRRSPEWYREHFLECKPSPHPLFRIKPGPIQDWERVDFAHLPK